MNGFENLIINLLLETIYYEFTDDKNSITSESCCKAIENYSHPFSWSNKRSIESLLRSIEEIPTELVSQACLFAWNQINWDLIAKSVRDRI